MSAARPVRLCRRVGRVRGHGYACTVLLADCAPALVQLHGPQLQHATVIAADELVKWRCGRASVARRRPAASCDDHDRARRFFDYAAIQWAALASLSPHAHSPAFFRIQDRTTDTFEPQRQVLAHRGSLAGAIYQMCRLSWLTL